MASNSNDLFKSISPLFWFLRLTGATPFHHLESSYWILAVRLCHPQSFWFIIVTFAHLSFILAQVFGGVYFLPVDHSNSQPSTVRYTNLISQTRFLVDTFLVSKLLLFNLATYQKCFHRLNSVDVWVPLTLSAVKRTRKVTAIGLVITSLWVITNFVVVFFCAINFPLIQPLAFFALASNDILGDRRNYLSGWTLVARIFDSVMHAIGQLHSNMVHS